MDPAVLEMANKLAEDCIAVQDEIGNDRLFMEVAQVLGASSQTLEEAFLTAIRTRMALKAGKQFLAQRIGEYRTQGGPKSAS